QRQPPRSVNCALVYRRDPRFILPADLPAISADEAGHFLEMLRQLAARLREWRAAARGGENAGSESLSPELRRRLAIRRFIHERCRQPISLADLAEHLHLSASRTAHLVRELCGMSFCNLVQEERLRQAAGLLRCTELPILEVALRSGFNDLSHFHRLFRRRFQLSPKQYRRQREAESPLARHPDKISHNSASSD
ncbi:MAG: helix-turn-helix transcriptional regulator, partial [Planctomycetota bacterium]|nr:helix-turn-helix transcriptional regulator [Planctomycetota bacterium]